jgi:hypothetical protein
MDEALTAFREAADQENLRRPQRRRYSPALQQQAVAYWQLTCRISSDQWLLENGAN